MDSALGKLTLQPAQWVDDVHSRSNAVRVAAVATPRDVSELCETVTMARERRCKLAIAGGRHAMGGQQFANGQWLIDTRGLAGGFDLDVTRGVVEVEAGIQWPELVAQLLAAQGERAGVWTITQKQSGADCLSVGGALASNIGASGFRVGSRGIVEVVRRPSVAPVGREGRPEGGVASRG